VLEPVIHKARVFEKIYLDLQEDEMDFSNQIFKDLYYSIVDALNQNPDFQMESLVNTLDPVLANEMTSILMDDERYSLADWHSKNIFPKYKKDTIAQLVSETILTLRCFLIDQKVSGFQQETLDNKSNVNKDILEEVFTKSTKLVTLSFFIKRER